MEKRFAAAPVTDDAPWISTGNWRAYRIGRVPETRYAQRVEQVFRGTSLWLDLPFWESIRVPGPSLARLHALMASLRPDTSALLFFDPTVQGDQLERRPSTDRIFKELDRRSDIEALTACMAILREAEIQNNEYQHLLAAINARQIFLRLAATKPFVDVAPAVFEHLNREFFRANYPHFPRHGQGSREVNWRIAIEARDSILQMLEDFGVIPIHPAAHRTCLYLADAYGLVKTFRELDELYLTADWEAVRAAPIVRWFTRRLRAIGTTASCID